MAPGESQSIESATATIRPDNKTRRYDRQLRLWAATGQAALESCRILALSASATSTSILKNLVLPGIGHFTILDPTVTSGADAGNNFFLDGPNSIGKLRASEAVPLLCELNDGVEGRADTRSVQEVLEQDPSFFLSFTVIIAHNLASPVLNKLSALLWSNESAPALIVVRSSGFLSEFFIQFHEHDIIESHSESAPSLRIDSPFQSLLDDALAVDLANMDITDHGHVPFVLILVRAMHDWKKEHGGNPPKTYEEKQDFKDTLGLMKRKPDEENFDEALAQAYRAWTPTAVPSDLIKLFAALPDPLSSSAPPFSHLLLALKKFTEQHDGHLPVAGKVPDMKADTKQYVALQRLYRAQAAADAVAYRALLDPAACVPDDVVDLFLKNAHAVRRLQGAQWGTLDRDPTKLAESLDMFPKETATHLALAALAAWQTMHPQPPEPGVNEVRPSAEELSGLAARLLPADVELPEKEAGDAIGEIARAPSADLPNVAAFLGGLVAQEAIKMITKQYVPVNGYCVADLVETWTSTLAP
ncbi:hypothetical protein K488DRAFT_55368 [Vararia minispora EC-137]|uniref:Uncharacterized protein n=1 Tax=Vararia minispora EC-137 TaxID=1314806 RepID=A0ACB8QEA2_9AGAM|nr:hypothetical protein K488DRAFT_55368 [Vararia minispora EC-137]